MKQFCLKTAFIILLFSFRLITCASSQGKGDDQSPNAAVPNSIIPPSPEGASLGKYGDIPLNLFKGTANVRVPIYELKKGDITLPISLDYSSSGNKVNDVSTNVGLGWTLLAGGAITISINDNDDLRFQRIFPYNFLTFNPNADTSINDPQYIIAKKYINGTNNYDLQADDYYYNVGGQSGRFFFDVDNTDGYSVPKNDFKIHRDSTGWKLTDAKGTIYTFNLSEIIPLQTPLF